MAPRSNYFFSRGDVGYGNGQWQNREGTVTLPDYDGDSSSNWHLKCASIAVKRGLFPLNLWHSIASVTDGTSNTIAVSEGLVSDDSREVKRNIAHSIANSPDNDTSRCAKSALTSDGRFYDESITMQFNGDINIQSMRGIRGFDGRITYSGFNTVFPPNSPQCMARNGTGEGGWGFFSPTSNHPMGVNATYADGSVRFISETINCGSLLSGGEAPRGEASRFGVWGALGSINGGETVTAP